MNRRSFFNFLGSAIIGTAIALKLPDNIVPLSEASKRILITAKALREAAMSCGYGNVYARKIIVHPEQYALANKLIENIPYIKNQNMILAASLHLKENQINIVGKHHGRFYFV